MKQKITLWATLLALLWIVPLQQASAAGGAFDAERMMDRTTWNSSNRYFNLYVTLGDCHGDSRDEVLYQFGLLLDDNLVFLAGVPQKFAGHDLWVLPFAYSYSTQNSGLVSDYHNNEWALGYSPSVDNLRKENSSARNPYDGTLYSVSISGSPLYRTYARNINSHHENVTTANFQFYPKVEWLPSDAASRTVEIKYGRMYVYEEGKGSSEYESIKEQSKRVAIDRPYSLTTNYDGKLQADGTIAFSATPTGSAIVYLYRDGSQIGSSQTASANTQKTFSTTPTSDMYRNGASYQIRTKDNKNSYSQLWVNGNAVTSEKIALFNATNGLKLAWQNEGKINLSWSMLQPSSGGSIRKDGFVIEYSTDGATWDECSGAPSYSTSKDDYSYTFTLPEAEREKGQKTYQFRINRANFNEGVFQLSKSITVNTNYEKLATPSITHIAGTNTAKISWSLTKTNGIWSNTDMRYELYIDGIKSQQDIELVKSGTVVLQETVRNIASCEPHKYELRLFTAGKTAAVSTALFSEDFIINTTAAKITSFNTSKGYYSSNVLAEWKVDQTANDYKRFELYRRNMSSNTFKEELVTEITNNKDLVNYRYEDTGAETGVYYTYQLKGIVSCNSVFTTMDSLSDIGFSQPYGSVSGRVTYAGSQAVEGVTLLFEGQSEDFSNRSLLFGRTGGFQIPGTVFDDQNMTFQAWLDIDPSNATAQQLLTLTKGKTNNTVSLSVASGTLSLNLNTTKLMSIPLTEENYFHLSMAYERVSTTAVKVTLYINGKQVKEQNCTIPALETVGSLLIGSQTGTGFAGNIDEIRVWNLALDSTSVAANYDRYLNGKETGLKAYYRCDEPAYVTGYVFDASAVKTTYNKNDAAVSAGITRASTNVPTTDQLSLKAVTDADGNYLINTLPYSLEGTSYKIVPSFGIHQFDPDNRQLRLSPTVNNINAIDFTDISAFKVSGKVTYANSNYPVDSVQVLIDGMSANKDGKVIMTDTDGNFTVEVPIGSHFISLEKQGHTFADGGRYPKDPDGEGLKHNFQTELSGFEFKDLTTTTLIGRVAGGQPQTDKPLGFGLSKANIGQATIQLATVSTRYNLNQQEKDSTITNTMNGKTSTTTFEDVSTAMASGSIINIQTNPETGEFMAVLPPVPYKIVGVKTAGFEDTFTDGDEVDFSYSKQQISMNPSLVFSSEYTDTLGTVFSLSCNDTLKITRYNNPIILVSDAGAEQDAFGDSIFVYENPATSTLDTIKLYNVNPETKQVSYALNYPVFTQTTSLYNWTVSAFEVYENKDDATNTVSDFVPLVGAELSLENGFASNYMEFDTVRSVQTVLTGSSRTFTLDDNGEKRISFNAGFPNLGSSDYLLNAKFSLVRNGLTTEKQIDGIVLGQIPTSGSNFVTQGPDAVDIVLPDPPGSYSYSYIEKGTSVSMETSSSFTFEVSELVEATLHLGLGANTITGMGFATEYEIDVIFDQVGTIGGNQIRSSGNTWSTTYNFSDRVSTSGDVAFVGNDADIYIGRSQNRVFGEVRQLAFYPEAEDASGTATAVGKYRLFPKDLLAVGDNFATTFTYTQKYIVETLIPNTIALRNGLLQTTSNIPTTVADNQFVRNGENVSTLYFTTLPATDPDFGKHGTYKVFFASRTPLNERVDEVQQYNNWVANWENNIAANEEAKVEMYAKRDELSAKGMMYNRSFNAGAHIEESATTEYTDMTMTSSSNVFLGAYSLTLGLVVNDQTGMEGTTTVGRTNTWDDSSTDTKTASISFGYELTEDGGDYLKGIHDAITVDIYKPVEDEMKATIDGGTQSSPIKTLRGYTFRTRAGQTSCPYEQEDSTLYYTKAGKKQLLNYGTFQVEKPDLYIDGSKHASEANIEAGKQATVTLQLQNQSASENDAVYQLYVASGSNPDGLNLSIDGDPIGDAPVEFDIAYNEEIVKTLVITQTTQDVTEYKNIELVLSSTCEDSPLTSASALLDVSFNPTSSPVSLTANSLLANQGALKKGGNITFNISGYNRKFKNFKAIRLQYRKATEQTWTTLQEYINEAEGYSVPDKAISIDDAADNSGKIAYDYTFTVNEPTDGNYLFRALAVSIIGTEEITAASEEITIVKDVQEPKLLGNPSPASGILTSADEISITFNEDIQKEMLTDDKFTITGILNADERAEPTVGLAFDGTGSANTEFPVYANGSFSIETWVKRPTATAGTLFSFGEGNSYLSLGFDEAGHAVVTNGSETFQSDETVEASDVWKYVGLSYDRSLNTLTVYALEETKNLSLITVKPTVDIPVQGKLYVGNDEKGAKGFVGDVAQLHFYNAARSLADASQSKSLTKSGTENNLIGYWELGEGSGNVAADKARARNLLINTAWYIYPSGKALAFNGTSDFAQVNGAYMPLFAYDDFTWEFWFKGAAQRNATLISCGAKANIGFDANGKLSVTTDNTVTKLSDTDYLDDQWHHIALSVKRNGNVNAYVDGKAEASFSSSIFTGEFSGDYYLGVRNQNSTNSVTGNTTYNVKDQYFKGNIDELRLWQSALPGDVIKLNKNHKLTGKEAGLKAYYPFESYQKHDQIIDVYASLEDMVDNTLEITNMSQTSDIAAPMLDCRPVKNVPFTYTASERKIVLNITEQEYRVEGVTLTITAKDVMDMNNNVSNTMQWIAYVNRNALKWNSEESVNLVMQQGDEASFKAVISNNGGSEVDYFIEGLPTWLTLSAAQGTLKPLATKELTFNVSQGINIGSYEASIVLTGVNKVREVLPVTLKVTGERPNWDVNPADYEMSMTVIGTIHIDGAPQEDDTDLLAAFIGDECVGVTSPQYIASNNAYMTFMTVNGNAAHNRKDITLKLWDASTGYIYSTLEHKDKNGNTVVTFGDTKIVGSPDEPVIHNALNIVEQSISLKNGWNWISTNVVSSDPSLYNQFDAGMGENGVQLKASDAYMMYNRDSWFGEISELDNKEMYMLKTNAAHTLKFNGKPADVKTTEIPLVEGWNWVGYIPQFTLPTTNALTSLNPQPGDQIKNQSAFRQYSAKGEWLGTLDYLRPGEGYMYYSVNSTPQKLVYPSVATNGSLRSTSLRATEAITKHWTADIHKYPNTMTVTHFVTMGGEEMQSSRIEVAAFAGDECRGSVLLRDYSDRTLAHPYIGFLMVYGEDSEAITFKVYNHDEEKEYTVESPESLSFENNAIIGEVETPLEIKVAGETTEVSTANSLEEQIVLYPNPTADLLYIKTAASVEAFEIVDMTGRLLRNGTDVTQGINVSDLAQGSYILKLTVNGIPTNLKFTKE
jgi:hypothetical protein